MQTKLELQINILQSKDVFANVTALSVIVLTLGLTGGVQRFKESKVY